MRLPAIALAALAVSSPALAQTKNVGQAVSNTLYQGVKSNYPTQDESWITSAVNAIQQANSDLYNTTCGAGKTWLCMAIYLQIPQPAQMAKGNRDNSDGAFTAGGGSYGGGGATGTWNDPAADPCDTHVFRLDVDGNLIVPTIPLAKGGALRYTRSVTDVGTHLWSSHDGKDGNNQVRADSPDAAYLWSLHNSNMSRDKRGWLGVYKFNPANNNGPTKSFHASSVAYWNGTTKVGRQGAQATPASYGATPGSQVNNQDCPAMPASGGDFDFYWNPWSCIWYAPNTSLSPSGYAYPTEASIPLAEALTYPKGSNGHADSTLACPLDPAFIKKLAQGLWDRANNKPGVPTVKTISDDDVKHDGEPPRMKELGDPPIAPPPDPDAPGPTPTPTPTPTATPTETVGDPPNVGDPVAPEIDWWPDLPTISLSFGNPECPTYDMSVPQFGWEATLDSHCPLIDANRAAIAVLMMLMFSVGSILIVLRA